MTREELKQLMKRKIMLNDTIDRATREIGELNQILLKLDYQEYVALTTECSYELGRIDEKGRDIRNDKKN